MSGSAHLDNFAMSNTNALDTLLFRLLCRMGTPVRLVVLVHSIHNFQKNGLFPIFHRISAVLAARCGFFIWLFFFRFFLFFVVLFPIAIDKFVWSPHSVYAMIVVFIDVPERKPTNKPNMCTNIRKWLKRITHPTFICIHIIYMTFAHQFTKFTQFLLVFFVLFSLSLSHTKVKWEKLTIGISGLFANIN